MAGGQWTSYSGSSRADCAATVVTRRNVQRRRGAAAGSCKRTEDAEKGRGMMAMARS